MRVRSLVRSVITPPASRLSLMRRSAIGSRESPLLTSSTSSSAMMWKPSPLALAIGAMLDRPKTDPRLQPGDEESLAIVDLLPPVEAAISLVEHVGRAGLDWNLTADLDVIDVRWRHLDAGRDIAQGVIDDVQLHAADATVPCRPVANLPQWYRTGVDQAHHLRPFAPHLPIRHRRQPSKGLRKNADRTAGIGIRQRRAGQLAGPQMIMVLRIGVEARHHPAQTVVTAQLRVDQRHQMVPALE